MNNLVWLKEIGKSDVLVAGGKGAQLGELKKAGFSVPEGFVVTTSVYKSIVEKLQAPIKNLLSNIDVENTVELEEASNKIRNLVISSDLPAVVQEELMEFSKKLGLMAVRSSATAEDQLEASFAGQMDTFLNIDQQSLIESIKKCFASLFSARAIYYREQKRVDHLKVHMAVVVQKMVNSMKAGVAFSANPLDNNQEEIVIEAASGLGEAVVSGEKTPDNYVIDKNMKKVKEKHIRENPSVLDEEEIFEISAIVQKLEKHGGCPQDVEWAIDEKNALYVMQSRPITTLNIKRKPVWKKIISREYGVQYTELSIKCLSPLNKAFVPAPFFEQVYIPENGNETCYIDESKWIGFVDALREKYFENPDNYEAFEEMFMKTGSEYMQTAKAISINDLKNKSNLELKEMYRTYLDKNNAYGPFIWMQFIINNFFAEKTKEIITLKVGKSGKNLFEYIEVALKPEKKAASVKLNEVSSKWESLDAAGKNKLYEDFKWMPLLDIHNKVWSKDEFFSNINQLIKPEQKAHAPYEMLIQEIAPSKKDEQILRIARRLSYLKDLKDDFRRQGIFYGQELFKEIASRAKIGLEDISYLTEEEIIDFLESKKTVDKNLIAERKRGFAIYFDEDKKVQCKSGKDIEPALNELGLIVFEEFSEEIRGTPASQGRAKGNVAIVRGVSDLNNVKKGDILVAVTTHPDYVPVMQKVVAIVTDEGGITSHAAIIARELGLPCIVGTKHATRSLKTGDKVEIDASLGIVRKVKKL